MSASDVQATSPVAVFQAVSRSEASAPKISSTSPATASVPPIALVQTICPSWASTQPTAAWNERAQSRSPVRTTGPIRSASRSTSLAPRGEPSGTSQRSVDESGSKPAMRGPWPATSVSLNAVMTPDCESVSGSPGRCTCQSLAPSAASKACTVRSTPSTNTRPPATSGAVATRTPSGFFQVTSPFSSATSSPARVTRAVTLPSLPTPAETLAPTLPRQSARPLSASMAMTPPSLPAIVSTLPLTATVSGNWTAPRLRFQAGRTAIGAVIGSSGFGFGLSGPNRLHPARTTAPSSAAALAPTRRTGPLRRGAGVITSPPRRRSRRTRPARRRAR